MSHESKRPRGRPRPPETIERDSAVLAHLRLNGAQTRNQIAESLGLGKAVAYLALNRLRARGAVRICAARSGSGVLWTTEVDQPCP